MRLRHRAAGCFLGILALFALLPPAQAEPLGSMFSGDATVQFVHVENGDNLMTLLTLEGIAPAEAQSAIDALAKVWQPKGLKIGQEIAIAIDGTNLQEIRFMPEIDREVIVTRVEGGRFAAEAVQRLLAHRETLASGVIHSSLFNAAKDSGLPTAVLDAMVRALSYDVDFQRDLQPEDSFEVVFDRLYDANGRAVGVGSISYAALTLSNKTQRIYRYTAPGEIQAEFYNERGECVKKALLRTPVDGARLTSGFGMRSHPILGYTRMHRGVDFGAPSGAPIMASGNGVVEQAGWHNGFGNFVLLRHNGTFETAYGHMSRIAVRQGMSVRQGQVIGYVGMTGMATGPHLHYEVRINGVQVKPAKVKSEPGRQLKPTELAGFRAIAKTLDEKIASLRRNALIAALPANRKILQ